MSSGIQSRDETTYLRDLHKDDPFTRQPLEHNTGGRGKGSVISDCSFVIVSYMYVIFFYLSAVSINVLFNPIDHNSDHLICNYFRVISNDISFGHVRVWEKPWD